jgi:3-phenylpropionate/trans-cinnamate dioxygenase ferredoxin reductase subunit
VLPRDELAAASGLAVNHGVLVDSFLATEDPAISAIGDCARFLHPSSGEHLCIESIQNATDQARNLARRLTGRAEPYERLPWFWSDQGGQNIQIAGLAAAEDEAVAVSGKGLSVYRFRKGRMVALETVNEPAEHAAARAVLTKERRPRPDDVCAEGFTLRTFAKSVAEPAT